MRRGLRSRSGPSLFDGSSDDALTVTGLTRQIKSCLEGTFGRIVVEGEIGNLTRARSGHLYLTLKDSQAVVDVVMWRSAAGRLRFDPQEGEKVVVRGEITVYEPRGRYQLVASSIQPVGKGDLQQKFEEMMARLREEGLFDPEHKKSIPETPSVVGVVTSATGAAVRDIIKVIRRRCPGMQIVLSPCIVQGAGSAQAIVKALQSLDRYQKCDVIIVGRGGGSLEDLWAFNEEPVARAIFAAKTPIISAVGHEVDVSISDMVADARGATPSEAAEMVAPDMAETARRIARLQRNLSYALTSHIRDAKTRLSALAKSSVLRRPMDLIHMRQQQLDSLTENLIRLGENMIEDRQHAMGLAAARLEALSPLGVLARGYSVTRKPDGTVIRSADSVASGDEIITHLHEGRVVSQVTNTETS